MKRQEVFSHLYQVPVGSWAWMTGWNVWCHSLLLSFEVEGKWGNPPSCLPNPSQAALSSVDAPLGISPASPQLAYTHKHKTRLELWVHIHMYFQAGIRM